MEELAGLYERISDDREGRALGIRRQDEDLTAAALDRGQSIVDRYIDNDISASTRSRKQRPEFRRLIEDARNGRINFIWAYTSNRLTRRPRESEDLIEVAEKHRVRIEYLRSPSFDLNTSHGRQIARIMAANDAAEAETIGERVSRKQLQIVEQGGFLGGHRPFGFEADGVTVREAEAEMIRLCTDRILAGASVGSLARLLNERGLPTSTGRAWTAQAIRKVLLRERNAGLILFQGEIAGAASWEAIVDEPTWRAVRAVLLDNRRTVGVATRERTHLGASLYLCGPCGDGTTVRTASTRTTGGEAVRAYRCRASGHLTRVADPVDDIVERAAVERLRRPDALDLLPPVSDPHALGQMRSEAVTIHRRIEELENELDDGQITRTNWARRTARLTERLDGINARLAAAAAGSVLAGLAGNPKVDSIWYGQSRDRSDGLPVMRRAKIVEKLMTVTLVKTSLGRQRDGSYFDPSCVRIEWKAD